jgi:hypothetical protein
MLVWWGLEGLGQDRTRLTFTSDLDLDQRSVRSTVPVVGGMRYETRSESLLATTTGESEESFVLFPLF